MAIACQGNSIEGPEILISGGQITKIILSYIQI